MTAASGLATNYPAQVGCQTAAASDDVRRMRCSAEASAAPPGRAVVCGDFVYRRRRFAGEITVRSVGEGRPSGRTAAAASARAMLRTTQCANTRLRGRLSHGEPHIHIAIGDFDLYLCFAAHFCIFSRLWSPFFCSRQPHFTWQLVAGDLACVLNLSPGLFLDRQFVRAIMGPKSHIFSRRVSSVDCRRAQTLDTNFFVQLIYRPSTIQCQTCALTKCLMS